MQLDISLAEFELEPLKTFDPVDFSHDPVIRALQETSLATSKAFVARMYVRRGNGRRLVWEVETDSGSAKEAVLADISVQATGAGVQFSPLVQTLALEFQLKEDSAIVLALALTFPTSLVRARMHLTDHRQRRRGKPRQVDQLTNRVSLLAEGWLHATGRWAGTADRALFVRALDVAKEFLSLRRRGDDAAVIEQMREFLRTEAKKIRSEDVRFVAPLNSLADRSACKTN